jgi:acyl-CoA thioesterase-1
MKRPIIIIIFLILLLILPSCNTSPNYGAADDIEENKEPPEANNYQGLRFETLNLDKDMILARSPRIICFGDSITFGWNIPYAESYPVILQENLKKTYRDIIVVNSGMGGNTVLDARVRLEEDALEYAPDLVVLNFGLNDSRIITDDSQVGKDADELETRISPSEYNNNYESIIGEIQNSGAEIIVIGLNATTDTIMWEETDITDIQTEKYLQFNSILEDLALSYQIEYIDLWSAFNESTGPGTYLQQDGIHPNEKGLELISELVKEKIEYLMDSI